MTRRRAKVLAVTGFAHMGVIGTVFLWSICWSLFWGVSSFGGTGILWVGKGVVNWYWEDVAPPASVRSSFEVGRNNPVQLLWTPQWLNMSRAARTEYSITIPLWCPFVAIAVPTLFVTLSRPSRSGLCPKCGYDLTGAPSSTCPECGKSAS
jgi:hypothetical protein